MQEYMTNYARQEGSAYTRTNYNHGTIIRWRCKHHGKYNNHHNLPKQVTNKREHKDLIDCSTMPQQVLLIEGQNIRQRKGTSIKLGCPFYISFTETTAAGIYRCSSIHSQHICNRDITSLE